MGPTIGPGIQTEPFAAAAAINTTTPARENIKGGLCMAFFNSAVGVLQTLVVALGAGLGIWGAINLLEGRTTSGGRQLCADRNGA